MPVVAVLNTKGGAGKTTIATNLAVAMARRGESVVLVDSDSQGSARRWGAAGGSDLVPVVGLDTKALDKDIRAVAGEWKIIDGPPHAADVAAAAIRAADLVLIPVQPSPYDIWAAQPSVEAIVARQSVTDGKPLARFVISRAIQNTALASDVADALAGYEISCLTARTCQRVAYAEAGAGQSVLDTNPEAAREVSGIVDEVLALLK